MVTLRPTATTNPAALDRLERMADQWADLVQEEAYDTAVGMDDAIRKAMSQTPPKFTGKRDWQTPLQQKAYHATDGFGQGIPYTRTGGMNDAYDLGFLVERGRITVTLYNTSGKTRFVVGPLTTGAPSYMQRMFTQAGYKPAAPIAAEQGEKLRAATARAIRLIPKNFR